MDGTIPPESRAARLRPAASSLAVAAFLVVVSGAWGVMRSEVPSDGAPVISDPGYRAGLTVDPAVQHGIGLHTGDVVVTVNGSPVDAWLGNPHDPRPSVRAGARLTYGVIRGGRHERIEVVLASAGIPRNRLRSDSGVLLASLAVLGLGLYTAYRRPEERAARALALLGSGLFAYSLFTAFGYDTADVVGVRPLFVFGLVGATATLVMWTGAAAYLALTFPSPPAFVNRRPRLVVLLFVVALALTAIPQTVLTATRHATLARLDMLSNVAGIVLFALALLTVVGLVRTLWLASRDASIRAEAGVVVIGLGVTVLVVFGANLAAGDKSWPPWVVALMLLPLPTAVTIALLRGQFLGIRAVVNRALVFTVLTALLVGVYAAAAVFCGAAIGTTGIASNFVATIAVAIAFAPLRNGLQRAVDRLLYGARGDPARTLGALGRRLENAVPPDEILPAVAETVTTTLNLPYVALRTGSGATSRLACERGDRVAETYEVPLVHRGEPIGELIVGARRGERSIGPRDKALLAEIALQIAAAVSAARLLTDLAASHSRLAVAREEERARLRHDLHDRLGPHLVGLSLQLDSLESHSGDDEIALALRRAHDEATRALDEVRRISRGLRPAELEDLGLVEAIGAAAARLTVGGDDPVWKASVDTAIQLGPIPPDVEAAAYQIALEAMTNAYRHSGGHCAHVRLHVDADGSILTVQVADDGTGIGRESLIGVGIASMRDRALAVDGRLAISDAPGGGTVVLATLPLTGAAPGRI